MNSLEMTDHNEQEDNPIVRRSDPMNIESQLHVNPEPAVQFVPQNQNASNTDIEGPRNRVVQVNMNLGNGDNDIEKDLQFSPYHYINRYGRNLKRSEVLGFGFISLSVISIALLAQLGLDALGFFDPSESKNVHPPHTFSWKLLTEFYTSDSLSNVDKDCLFGKKQIMFRNDEDQSSGMILQPVRSAMEDFFRGGNTMEDLLYNETIKNSLPHMTKCKYTQFDDGWSWLSKYISSMFFSFLNIFCSLIYLTCIRCRRKKVLQFGLLVPSFICFFLDIFQQIPLTFHFNYASLVLMEDMRNALASTVPPVVISPIWEETQIHGQCCGIQSHGAWNVQGFDAYPRSCCNTTAFSCPKDGFPTKAQIWSTGCFQKEYDRLHHFEGFALLLLFLKLFAEIGLFWTLSDLTRYEYPRPEHVRNSLCHVKGYDITTKGCVTTLGVTERQRATIKLRNFVPGKYHLALNQYPTNQTITIRILDKLVGSIEIRSQVPARDRNDENDKPVINLERGRNRGLIFVSF